MVDTALQYGAMGLLALILVPIGIWFKKYTEHQIAAMTQQQQFIQKIAAGAIASQEEHTRAWRTMTQQTNDAQVQFAELIRAESKAQRAEHEVIIKALAAVAPRGT